MDIQAIQERLQKFADERQWEQYHTPKNLVMGLCGEVGELIEHFQWLTAEESKSITHDEPTMEKVREELADVQIYLLRLADKLNIDMENAIWDKIKKNESKYPAHLVKGSAKKYTEY
jgi:NTP pyrophosphatase (non-canonical NTP hydrolase)